MCIIWGMKSYSPTNKTRLCLKYGRFPLLLATKLIFVALLWRKFAVNETQAVAYAEVEFLALLKALPKKDAPTSRVAKKMCFIHQRVLYLWRVKGCVVNVTVFYCFLTRLFFLYQKKREESQDSQLAVSCKHISAASRAAPKPRSFCSSCKAAARSTDEAPLSTSRRIGR